MMNTNHVKIINQLGWMFGCTGTDDTVALTWLTPNGYNGDFIFNTDDFAAEVKKCADTFDPAMEVMCMHYQETGDINTPCPKTGKMLEDAKDTHSALYILAHALSKADATDRLGSFLNNTRTAVAVTA